MDFNPNRLKKILLVSPSYSFIYEGTAIKVAALYSPCLSLATIAGALVSRGHNVKILDLNKKNELELLTLIKAFDPDYIGITFTTPLAEEAFRLACLVKKIKKDVIVIGGGAHSSAMPLDVLESSDIDIVCIGEADYTVLDIVDDKPRENIEGIAFKHNNRCFISQNNKFITDLDNLPFPAWNLFNLNEYRTTRLLTRKNPAGTIETSRGCPYNCVYCSKNIFGRNFRSKSVKRVADEIGYMLSCGFREIHIQDECFTFDIKRAKDVCKEIIKRGLKFPWTTIGGIRVDRVDQELLNLMKKAGCYRVYYGIESQDEKVLRLTQKGQTCNEVSRAVEMSKQAGLEVVGFFMFALPGETQESMRRTMDFAKGLDLDMAKVAICIPFPGTPYFEELKLNGKIKKTSWSKYNFYLPARELYDHPNVNWDIIDYYYKRFYREFYFRPRFIAKRFIKSLLRGGLINDTIYFLKSYW